MNFNLNFGKSDWQDSLYINKTGSYYEVRDSNGACACFTNQDMCKIFLKSMLHNKELLFDIPPAPPPVVPTNDSDFDAPVDRLVAYQDIYTVK